MTIDMPISDASPMWPGRILYIHAPVINAAGIVAKIVNNPQGLSPSALTTTMPTPDSVAITINSVATVAVTPETGPIMFRAIFGSERPSCRTDASSTTKSCTPPARHAPMTIQQ